MRAIRDTQTEVICIKLARRRPRDAIFKAPQYRPGALARHDIAGSRVLPPMFSEGSEIRGKVELRLGDRLSDVDTWCHATVRPGSDPQFQKFDAKAGESPNFSANHAVRASGAGTLRIGSPLRFDCGASTARKEDG